MNFVWYRVLQDPPGEGDAPVEGISRSCDISRTGIGLVVSQPIESGTSLFLEIVTKSFNLSAVGAVTYSQPFASGAYRLGIVFRVIPPNDRLLLEKHFGGDEEI